MKKILLTCAVALACSSAASAQLFSAVWTKDFPVRNCPVYGVADGNDLYLYLGYGMGGSWMQAVTNTFECIPEAMETVFNGETMMPTAATVEGYTYGSYAANAVKVTYAQPVEAGEYTFNFGTFLTGAGYELGFFSDAPRTVEIVAPEADVPGPGADTIEFTIESAGYKTDEAYQVTVSPSVAVFSSTIECWLEDEDEVPYELPQQPMAWFTPAAWFNIFMPTDLPTDLHMYTLVIPEGYLTDEEGNINSEIRFTFPWGESTADPVALTPEIIMNAFYTSNAGVKYGTTIEEFTNDILIAVQYNGNAVSSLEVDRDKAAGLRVYTDTESRDYPSFILNSPNGNKIWLDGVNCGLGEWSIDIPEGMLMWKDSDGNPCYNEALTVDHLFSVTAPLTGEAPAVPEIEYVEDLNVLALFCETPGAYIAYTYTVGAPGESYSYTVNGIVSPESDEDCAYEEMYVQINADVPAGAPLYVSCYSYVEEPQFTISETAEAVYTVAGARETLMAPVLTFDPSDDAPAGGFIKAGVTVTLTNPNEAGQLVYNCGTGLKITVEKHVSFTVTGDDGDQVSVFAYVAPLDEETSVYTESARIEYTWEISGITSVAQLRAADADTRVFTLEGTEVSGDLQPGLYIVVRGGKAEKAIVR